MTICLRIPCMSTEKLIFSKIMELNREDTIGIKKVALTAEGWDMELPTASKT